MPESYRIYRSAPQPSAACLAPHSVLCSLSAVNLSCSRDGACNKVCLYLIRYHLSLSCVCELPHLQGATPQCLVIFGYLLLLHSCHACSPLKRVVEY
jgi:hypothetical protein